MAEAESDKTYVKDYVWTKRDEVEAYRLNFQHRLALAVSDETLVHPSVPISQVKNVADVATGTGIWLDDFEKKYPSSADRHYAGFDINDKLFPASTPNVTFEVQDMLQPFPAKYHNHFDLVHVRYMVMAFRKEQYQPAVKSLLQILKPGGFLQWDEMNLGLVRHIPNDPALQSRTDIVHEFSRSVGFSLVPKDETFAAFEAEGLEKVQLAFWDSVERKDLEVMLQEWGINSMTAAIPVAYLRTGRVKNEEEAKVEGEKGIADFRRLYKLGSVPVMPESMVIGRKPV